MKKAIIYARVSTKEQEKEGYSIPAQIKFLNDYAEKNELYVIREFVDTETAKKAGRSGFNEMISYLKKHKDVRTILVEKTDRLYRNFKDYVLIDESEYDIHLVKEGTILNEKSRSHEKFIHGIKVLMAKNYIDNLKEETKKGLREKAAQGYYPGKAPLGYKNITDKTGKKIIVINEEKAFYVRRAFELYATGNYSLKRLNDKLNEEGYVNHLGKKSPKSFMGKMLANVFYTGVFEYEGKRYDNAKHKALIDPDLFYLVQSKMKDPRKEKTHQEEFSYTNLIQCSKCGCMLTAELKKGRHGRGRYIYYHCTGNKGGDCKKDYIRQEDLDIGLGNTLQLICLEQELINKVIVALKEVYQKKIAYTDESEESIHKQIKVLKQRIEQSYIDKLDGKISEEFWQQKNNAWQSEKDKLFNKLKIYNEIDKNYLENSNRILNFCKNAHSLFLKADAKEKRQIVNLV